MNTLIVYGTRYGATASTSEEISKILQAEGFTVKVANAKEEKIKDITPYDLIVVGTGLQMFKWVGEIEDFLKRHQNELNKKKTALFVSTMKNVFEREGKTEETAKHKKMVLDDKLAKFNLNLISVGFFGGIINYNKMNILTRKMFAGMREQLTKDGFKEDPPGVYETRNMEEIQAWAKELAQKARQ
jgi:menaquinone-dependent protoporphyrinogen IX oxidase